MANSDPNEAKRFSKQNSRHSNDSRHSTPLVKPKLTAKTKKVSHPSDAFLKRCSKEREKLRLRISNELQSHLNGLYNSEIFSDLTISCGSLHKKVHSAILRIRIPNFYRELLTIQSNHDSSHGSSFIKIPPFTDESQLNEFLRKVYCDDDIESEEIEIINKLKLYINQNCNYHIFSDMSDESESHDCNTNEAIHDDDTALNITDISYELKNVEIDKSNDSLQSFSNKNIDANDDESSRISSGECDSDTNIDGDDPYIPNAMVRSGTYDLLSNVLQEEAKGKFETNDSVKVNESHKTDALNNSPTVNDAAKSMFQYYIEVNPNKSSDDKLNHKEKINSKESNEKKNSKPNVANKKSEHKYRANDIPSELSDELTRNKPALSNKNDEQKENTEIPLLPMSPIIRKKDDSQESINDSEKDLNTYEIIPIKMVSPINKRNEIPESSKSLKENYENLNFQDDDYYKSMNNDDDSETIWSEVSDISASFAKRYLSLCNDLESNQTFTGCSKLGEDLLKLFMDGINTDVIIKIDGREIKCHKCILSSRCRYFNAMLSGNWSESDSNTIELVGFSYDTVYFTLCHIYCGTITLPKENLDLLELALLADLLVLDSLKEIIMFELQMSYCHFFHKPCEECITGVVQCLHFCSQCNLLPLYEKCISWIGKYFFYVWSNKTFSSLKPHLIDAAFQNTVSQITPDNVLEVNLECEKLITSLPHVKWTNQIFALIGRLIEETCNFIAENYDMVIVSNAFVSLGRTRSWNVSTLEESLLASMTKLTPDISCRTFIQLEKINLLGKSDASDDGFGYGPFTENFVKLTNKMQRYCERYIIQNINAVVRCHCWSLLNSEAQKRIKDSAVFVIEFDKPIAKPPKFTSSLTKKVLRKKSDASNESETTDQSKGAISKVRRVKPTRPVSTPVANRDTKNDHIYDQVPHENIRLNDVPSRSLRVKPNLSADTKHPRKQTVKQSPVAKVMPYKSETTNDTVMSADLCAEIDAESSLVTDCLREAELLEQELTRKLKKQTSSGHTRQSTQSTRSPRVTSTRTNNSKGSSKQKPSSGNSRSTHVRQPPFK